MKNFVIEKRILKKYKGHNQDVVIPNEVEIIAESAFKNHHTIKSVYIPEGVTKINDFSFSNCNSLQRVSLPNSIVFCGDYSFGCCVPGNCYKNCYYLGNEDNPYYLLLKEYSDIENTPKIHEKTKLIIDGVGRHFDKLPENAYTRYDNAFYIGSESNPYHLLVKAINTDIKTCTIHKDTKIINVAAFKDCCNLEAMAIPEDVCSIGSTAFMGCTALQKVDLPISLRSISRATFKWCEKLKEIEIPNGVLHIGDQAFYGCESLINAVIPNGTLTLDKYSFGMCHNLQKVVLPQTLILIDENIFNSIKINTTIHAPADSYAIKYAKKNGIPFKES